MEGFQGRVRVPQPQTCFSLHGGTQRLPRHSLPRALMRFLQALFVSLLISQTAPCKEHTVRLIFHNRFFSFCFLPGPALCLGLSVPSRGSACAACLRISQIIDGMGEGRRGAGL